METKENSAQWVNIPQIVRENWQARHSRGDEKRIQESTKLSRPTISKALNHGYASYETIVKICAFYSTKKVLTIQDIEDEALKILNGEQWKLHYTYIPGYAYANR